MYHYTNYNKFARTCAAYTAHIQLFTVTARKNITKIPLDDLTFFKLLGCKNAVSKEQEKHFPFIPFLNLCPRGFQNSNPPYT
jgi:hypothetical protein